MEFFKEKYYRVNKIPKHRLEYIDLKVQEFKAMLNINDFSYPLDIMKLANRIIKENLKPLEFILVKMNSTWDGFSIYVPDRSIHVIHINIDKVRYPYKCSGDRRLNFIVARELGRIFLSHSDIPDELKTEEEKAIEELEAIEFASRLLMPEKLLHSCNFYHLHIVAANFLVSKRCLWIRLNNLKKLAPLKSKPAITALKQWKHSFFTIFTILWHLCYTSAFSI